MRIRLEIFIALLLAIPAFGQNYTLPLWPDKIPNFQPTYEKEIRDSVTVLSIYNVQNPDIAVYLPSQRIANGQAVVICPGGGYKYLAYDREGIDIAKWLNSKGIAGIILKYRLPGSKSNSVPHKSPLLDAQRAMRLVRFHAKEWKIDPARIGIMGFSAGGHLASTLGTHFDLGQQGEGDSISAVSSRPDFMILVYPVISMSQEFMHKGSQQLLLGENPDAELMQYYSNDLQVSENTPPTFIIHASDDTAVPVENSLAFYRALIEKNVSAEMHIYPKGGHGFTLAVGKYYLETWPDRCVDWLRSLD